MTSSQATIMVVDDRPANRYIVAHTLQRAGFAVIEAATGQQALELSNTLPQAIILDVKLPDILGYEVCRRIKANTRTSHIPVLQLSAAFLSDESKVHALESGADAFLTQPVESNVLVATVKSLVRLHNAESQTRLLGQQWQTTFDALSDGIALVDAEGRIQRSNRAMTVLLDRTYQQIEKLPIAQLLREVFEADIEGQQLPLTREVKLESRYFRMKITPVLTDDNYTGSVLILSEITDQKLAQAALLVNERFASTGRIANTIAHEINNPLEAITNLLYLMNTTLDSPDTLKQHLALAQEQLSRVSRIARQILSFNRESTVHVPLSVATLLDDVLALNNRDISRKNIIIHKDWPNDTSLQGFPAQLRQVFSNMLRNAVEASRPESAICIRITRVTGWGPREEAVLRISFGDHGTGISPKDIDRIFEAFYTTKELRGSGIGLWLSANIVEEHRGRIHVRSRNQGPSTGTCITVILPISQLQ